jgi:hypothetical protein
MGNGSTGIPFVAHPLRRALSRTRTPQPYDGLPGHLGRMDWRAVHLDPRVSDELLVRPRLNADDDVCRRRSGGNDQSPAQARAVSS